MMDTRILPAIGGRYERDAATGDLRRVGGTPANPVADEIADAAVGTPDPDQAEAAPAAAEMEG